MSALIPFLRARLAERSTRIQLVVLVLLCLVLAGIVSLDQINAWAASIMGSAVVLMPLLSMLVPDNNSAISSAAAMDARVGLAVQVATDAAEKAAGPEATAMAKNVTALVEKLGL